MTGNNNGKFITARLQEAALELNRESDALTATLQEVERALNSIGLGVAAQLPEPILKESRIDVDIASEGVCVVTVHQLGYGRVVGKSGREWGIYVESSSHADLEPTYRGIQDLSRDMRVLVAEALPKLMDQIASEAEQLLNQIRRAKTSAQEAAKKLSL